MDPADEVIYTEKSTLDKCVSIAALYKLFLLLKILDSRYTSQDYFMDIVLCS